MEITSKQLKFAESIANGEFDYDWQAYDAHYNTAKMSKNAIYVESCRLRQHPRIALKIQEIVAENQIKHHATLEEVLTEMASWLRFDPIDMINDDGTVKAMSELPQEVRKSIASFEVSEIWGGTGKDKMQLGELKRIKLVDKRSTADMFLKKMGQYITKHEITESSLEFLEDIFGGLEK